MAGLAAGGAETPRLLRLVPLGVNDVPEHLELAAAQSNAPSVSAFLAQCLREAGQEDFGGFAKTGEVKESVAVSGGRFPVVVEKLKKKGEEGGMWFGRRSVHADEVSFEELDAVVRTGHEKNEMEYTPAIYEANTLVEWGFGEAIEGVKDVEMRITQMHHTMPAPALLNDRVFTVLLISFIATSPASGTLAQSIDLQLPVDLSTFPFGIKARSHTVASSSKLTYKSPDPATSFQKKQDGRKLVEGKYVSLEKLSKVEVDGKVVSKWEMKTASDAEGALPLGVQKLGVPGAIVKDVPLALEYIVKKRGA
ncbi:hypothetical protein N0V90_003330 [Kalmusia sp. IMI 367209]|nr:hypothetical protein N0V90_003330 [Kalmusia sp. IMI 367209]